MKFQNVILFIACVLVLSCNKSVDEEQLEVSSQSLNIDLTGSKDSFTIKSNVEWQITGAENWFSFSQTSGKGNAKIYVTATQNNATGNTRVERITVKPVGNTGLYEIGGSVKQCYEKLSTKWSRLYGGSQNDSILYMAKANDGGFILAGNASSNDGDLTAGFGDADAWLLKLDSNGTKQWSKKFGGSGTETAMSVVATSDGGYVAVGVTSSTNGDAVGNHGGRDYFVLKVDGSGNKQWSKVFGGTGDEKARSVTITTDGGYLVAGETGSTDGDLAGLVAGGWLVRLDASGNKQWSKTYGGSGAEQLWSIVATSDGGYAVAGIFNTTSSNKDAWIFKTDGTGNLIWNKTFGGSMEDRAWSLVRTTDGGYVFSGGAYSKDGDLPGNYGVMDAWVVKLDGNGNKAWSKIFGGLNYDLGDNITGTADGGFLLSVSTRSFDLDGTGNTSWGGEDALVIKLGADGNKQWSKIYGGTHDDWIQGIVTTPDGFALTGIADSKDGIMRSNHGKSDGYLIKEKVQ